MSDRENQELRQRIAALEQERDSARQRVAKLEMENAELCKNVIALEELWRIMRMRADEYHRWSIAWKRMAIMLNWAGTFALIMKREAKWYELRHFVASVTKLIDEKRKETL